MADNRLKSKAIANYHAGLGWYTGDAEGDIDTSPENVQVIKAQQPNYARTYVLRGKARHRRLGK